MRVFSRSRSFFTSAVIGLVVLSTSGCGAIMDSVSNRAASAVAGEPDPTNMHVPREQAPNPVSSGKALVAELGTVGPAGCGAPPEPSTLTVHVTPSQICLDEILYVTLKPTQSTAPDRRGTQRRLVTESGQTDLLTTQFAVPPQRVLQCRQLEMGDQRPLGHQNDPDYHPTWGDRMVNVSVMKETRHACAPNSSLVGAKTPEILVKRPFEKDGTITLGGAPEIEYVAWHFTP